MVMAHKKLTREGRSEQSRAIILQAATELLLKNGYRSFTINHLIDYMGGSKKTIYKYFSNRDGLVLAIIDNELMGVTKSLDDLSLSDMGLSEGLNYVGNRVLKVIMVKEFLYFRKLVVHESINKPKLGHEFYENLSSRSYLLLSEFFKYHIDCGNLKVIDSLRLARHFWAMMLHYQMVLVDFGIIEAMSEKEIREHVKHTIDDFLLAFGT